MQIIDTVHMCEAYRIHLSKAIKFYRKKRGWSYSKLGQKAGVTPSVIERLEAGIGHCRMDTVFCILEAFDLNFIIFEGTYEDMFQRIRRQSNE